MKDLVSFSNESVKDSDGIDLDSLQTILDAHLVVFLSILKLLSYIEFVIIILCKQLFVTIALYELLFLPVVYYST